LAPLAGLTFASQRRGRMLSKTQRAGLCRVRSLETPCFRQYDLLFKQERNEEVARITFDENDVPLCISQDGPGLKRKFGGSTRSLRGAPEFDPETGKLHAKSTGRNCPTPIDPPCLDDF